MAAIVVDVGLGAAVALLVLVTAWMGIGPAGAPDARLTVAAVGIAVGLAGALSVRRRYPFAVLVAVNVGTLGWFLAGDPGRFVALVPAIALYTVTAHRGWRWGLGAVAVTGVTLVLISFTGVSVTDEPPNPELVFIAFTAGLAVRYRRELADAVRGRLVREAQAREAEQRLRIAQEVHDIVGHAMATISVQAGVAIHVVEQRPAQALEALTAIKKISDEGLADIKSVLSDVPRTPVGLDRLEELVDATSAAGPRVGLTVTGTRRPLPAAVELAAYRIVQESLTNVLRHAHADAVQLRLAYAPDTLTIRVRDNGVGGPAEPEGRGIAGMRRRVGALSGQFTAGPGPDGGFEIRCELPG